LCGTCRVWLAGRYGGLANHLLHQPAARRSRRLSGLGVCGGAARRPPRGPSRLGGRPAPPPPPGAPPRGAPRGRGLLTWSLTEASVAGRDAALPWAAAAAGTALFVVFLVRERRLGDH